MKMNFYLFGLLLLLLCKPNAGFGCRTPSPSSGFTTSRFSLTIWSNASLSSEAATVFTSSSLVVNASKHDQTSKVTVNIVPLSQVIEFPFEPEKILFPGAIVISYYRFTWSVYALVYNCTGFVESSVVITVPAFTFTYPMGTYVTVPSRVPSISDFDACNEQITYSQTEEFSVDPDLFPVAPVSPPDSLQEWISPGVLVFSESTGMQSMCKYPRRMVYFIIGTNVTEPIRIGEERLLSTEEGEDVNGTYGSTFSNDTGIFYKTYDSIAPYTRGTDRVYFPRAMYILHLVPSIAPISKTILTTNSSITIEIEASEYVQSFGYYFRVENRLVLPGELVTLEVENPITVIPFTLEATCQNFLVGGTITIIKPTPITFKSTKYIPQLTSSDTFVLGEYLNIEGDPGEILSVEATISNGQFTSQVCEDSCSTFTHIGNANSIRVLLNQVTVNVPHANLLIGDYDGVRITVNDTIGYLRFEKSLNTTGDRGPSVIHRVNADVKWIIIHNLTIFGISMFLLLVFTVLAFIGRQSRNSVKRANANEELPSIKRLDIQPMDRLKYV